MRAQTASPVAAFSGAVLLAPLLCLALLSGARAQTSPGVPVPNTTEPGANSAPERTPSAANPNPMTPSPQAADMPTYVGLLQKAANDLRDAIPRTEGNTAPSQGAATSPALQQLMHAMAGARSVVERAPASFTDNAVYKDTVRDMRAQYSDIISRTPSQPNALEAARKMVESLERLRQTASAS